MSKNNQEDMSLSVIVFICILLGGVIWAVSSFAPQVLVPWKMVRAAELAVTFQWETLSKMWAYEFKEYGKAFHYVNEQVWDVFKWLCIPIGYSAWKAAQQVNLNWTMEDHLQVLFGRFRWLSVVMRVPSGIGLSKKFPFVTFDMFVTYNNVEFPIGLEPLDYFAKYRENLPDVLKGQLGPMIKIKDKKIVWQDKFAEEVAMTCYKRIPNTKATADAKKTWREQAWASCSQNHRFERTFALGMLQAARDFGVLSAIEFLHLRKLAAVELKKNNRGLFEFWRAIVSLGGRCVYPEGAGIICHYYFEKALTDYLTTNPNDKEVAHYMRAQPWVKNALDSFFDVDRTVMQAPDVVSLRKAGLLRR